MNYITILFCLKSYVLAYSQQTAIAMSSSRRHIRRRGRRTTAVDAIRYTPAKFSFHID